MVKHIQVIANPASGQPEAVLSTLNSVFHPAGIRWGVSITHESGDATRLAKAAAASGVDLVLSYGGDGTVMEVAEGLMGSNTPMAILPGGTANLMSHELGIPKDLAGAARTAVSENSMIREVDMGLAGERYFILRVGIGFAGEKVKQTDRELKDRFGLMAYTIGALKALKVTKKSRWKIILDGELKEAEGISLLVDNSGNFGISGVTFSQKIRVDDGLLDVIVIRDVGFKTIYSLGASVQNKTPDPESFYHWQGREIQIESDPPQPINGDGEMWGQTPISIKVIPGAVKVVAPAPSD